MAAGQPAERDRKQIYSRVLAAMTPDHAKGIARAERIWLSYRDAFCASEHDLFDGGTAGLSAEPTCRLSLTRQHVGQLKDAFWWRVEKFSK